MCVLMCGRVVFKCVVAGVPLLYDLCAVCGARSVALVMCVVRVRVHVHGLFHPDDVCVCVCASIGYNKWCGSTPPFSAIRTHPVPYTKL